MSAKPCWFCNGAGVYHWDSLKATYPCPVCRPQEQEQEQAENARQAEMARVEITYELGGKFWHTNCPKNSFRSGIMRERCELREPDRSIVECLHCGERGYYPVGAVGAHCSEKIAPPQEQD